MGNPKNLVISSAFGVSEQGIDFFLKSLRKYYSGEVYFFVGPNDNKIKNLLNTYKCNFSEIQIHKHDVQLKRYKYYLEYLNRNIFDNILCCDSRDIYFQDDPFNFLYKGSINFFLEGKKIKDCIYNKNWLIKTHGNKIFENIKEKTILCSGTVVGKYKTMIEYLQLINQLIHAKKYKKSLKYLLTFRRDKSGRGCDQAHANFIGHNNLIKNGHFYSNDEGPIATAYYLKKIVFNKKSQLINKSGKHYLLVHQYDKRLSDFSNYIENFKKLNNV